MMSNTTTKPLFSLSGIVCSTVGHQFVVTRKITNHINEYRCTKCGCEMTDNDAGKLVSLNNHTKKINSVLATFFEKRTRRQLSPH